VILNFKKNGSGICSIEGFILLSFVVFSSGCEKDDRLYTDDVQTIEITKDIRIDNGFKIHDPIYNFQTYEKFLKYLASSDRFLIVSQKDFTKTASKNKVVLSLRYDIDDNINAAVKFAYREHKHGIKSTYYFLHTAKYYGKTASHSFKRNNEIIYYLKKIQDSFGHEIGFHNDLVTLQIVYGINPKIFLADQLKWLRDNGISVSGTCAHGSPYCYIYHYVNSYFWNGFRNYEGIFNNYEYVTIRNVPIKIEKDELANYNLEYNADLLTPDYFFSDINPLPNGQKWHMGLVNFDTIQPGKKVIIMLHPQKWD
jgi:hypothetical protein